MTDFKYTPTHRSSHDHSEAMLVSVDPPVFMNEVGETWLEDNPKLWYSIPFAVVHPPSQPESGSPAKPGPFAEPGNYCVVLNVPITADDEVPLLDKWDWEDLVGVGTTAEAVYFIRPPREWQPMTMPQIRKWLSGHLRFPTSIEGYGDATEVRETEHGVEYR